MVTPVKGGGLSGRRNRKGKQKDQERLDKHSGHNSNLQSSPPDDGTPSQSIDGAGLTRLAYTGAMGNMTNKMNLTLPMMAGSLPSARGSQPPFMPFPTAIPIKLQ